MRIKNSLFFYIRLAILSLLLLIVACDTYLNYSRTTAWNHSLRVVLYPINADGDPLTQTYIQRLNTEHFKDVEDFFKQEALRLQLKIAQPFQVKLGPTLETSPPALTRDGVLSTMWWSLKIRFWAYFVEKKYPHPSAHIQVFVNYYHPGKNSQLPSSHGMQKGLLGVVNAYADDIFHPTNQVIIAHEILHTVGASDKYERDTNLPQFPHGYALPRLEPLYPQTMAEIMGGRVPLSPEEAVMPRNLRQTLIGESTAREIHWSP